MSPRRSAEEGASADCARGAGLNRPGEQWPELRKGGQVARETRLSQPRDPRPQLRPCGGHVSCPALYCQLRHLLVCPRLEGKTVAWVFGRQCGVPERTLGCGSGELSLSATVTSGQPPSPHLRLLSSPVKCKSEIGALRVGKVTCPHLSWCWLPHFTKGPPRGR